MWERADIIDMARAMEAAINDELDDVAEKIEDAEARIAAEDGGYAAKSGDGDDDDEENGANPQWLASKWI